MSVLFTMVSALSVVGIGLLTLIVVGVILFMTNPIALLSLVSRVRRWLGGLSKRRERLRDGFRFAYLDGEALPGCADHAPAIVCLHGFSSEMHSFLDVAVPLRKYGRVIVPEMPGHGESGGTLDDDYRPAAQAARVCELVDRVIGETARVHVVGLSMGGHVAGTFAALYPDRCVSVTLCCPAGVRTPIPSEYVTDIVEKHAQVNDDKAHAIDNLLMPSTVAGFRTLLEWNFVTPPDLPDHICEALLAQREANRARLERVFTHIAHPTLGAAYFLDDHLDQIRSPLLVLWGKQDRILHPSGAQSLASRCTSAAVPPRVILLDNAAHSINLEHPELLASHIAAHVRTANKNHS